MTAATPEPDQPREDPLHCLACGRPKTPRKYLCDGCWFTLPPATRKRLDKRDDVIAAARRLGELRRQIRAKVALHMIEVPA